MFQGAVTSAAAQGNTHSNGPGCTVFYVTRLQVSAVTHLVTGTDTAHNHYFLCYHVIPALLPQQVASAQQKKHVRILFLTFVGIKASLVHGEATLSTMKMVDKVHVTLLNMVETSMQQDHMCPSYPVVHCEYCTLSWLCYLPKASYSAYLNHAWLITGARVGPAHGAPGSPPPPPPGPSCPSAAPCCPPAVPLLGPLPQRRLSPPQHAKLRKRPPPSSAPPPRGGPPFLAGGISTTGEDVGVGVVCCQGPQPGGALLDDSHSVHCACGGRYRHTTEVSRPLPTVHKLMHVPSFPLLGFLFLSFPLFFPLVLLSSSTS